MRNIISYIICALLLLSCNERIGTAEENYIGLSASIGNMEIDLKSVATADPFLGTTPEDNNPLTCTMMFSYTSGIYPHSPEAANLYIPCRTQITFNNSNLTYATYTPVGAAAAQYLTYPTSTDAIYSTYSTVYATGLYPVTGWTFSQDNTSASYNINGTDDIMYAPQISGTWISQMSQVNFKHLQTWIKVEANATNIEVAKNWGNITRVEIQTSNSLSVNFSTGAVTPSNDTQNLVIYNNDNGAPISITTSNLASAFVAPSLTYNVKVYTTNFPDGKNVSNISLMDMNGETITDISNVQGKLFVLNLNFTPFSVVEGVCTLNYWNDQNEDLYLE